MKFYSTLVSLILLASSCALESGTAPEVPAIDEGIEAAAPVTQAQPAPSTDLTLEPALALSGGVGATSTTQCGSTCPSGQHPVAKLCTKACNGGFTCTSSSFINTVVCEANSSQFGQCDTTCPGGWHPTAKRCSSACQNGLPCSSSSFLNFAQCETNSGSFNQCGTTCPSGWRTVSTFCRSDCQNGLTCRPLFNNASRCEPM